MTSGDLSGRHSAGEIIGGIAGVIVMGALVVWLASLVYSKLASTPPAQVPVVSTDYNACDPAAFDPADLGPTCGAMP